MTKNNCQLLKPLLTYISNIPSIYNIIFKYITIHQSMTRRDYLASRSGGDITLKDMFLNRIKITDEHYLVFNQVYENIDLIKTNNLSTYKKLEKLILLIDSQECAYVNKTLITKQEILQGLIKILKQKSAVALINFAFKRVEQMSSVKNKNKYAISVLYNLSIEISHQKQVIASYRSQENPAKMMSEREYKAEELNLLFDDLSDVEI